MVRIKNKDGKKVIELCHRLYLFGDFLPPLRFFYPPGRSPAEGMRNVSILRRSGYNAEQQEEIEGAFMLDCKKKMAQSFSDLKVALEKGKGSMEEIRKLKKSCHEKYKEKG